MHESDAIVQSLGYGELAAISADQLQTITGLDARTLRFVIQELRKMGLCILSGANGYWLPDLDADIAYQECKRFSRMMKARAISSLQTARITEIYLRSLDGQQTIEGFDAFALIGNEE